MKLCDGPEHPLEVGVTVIVAVPAPEVAKALISPVPLAANPIEEVVFVQLKTVPLTLVGEEKITPFVVAPKQTV